MKRNRRELIDLWIAVSILLLAVVYHFGVSAMGGIERLVGTEAASWVSDGLFIWLIGLLWIAHQRWKGISRKQAFLDDVISSTGLEVVMVVDDQDVINLCNDSVLPVFGYHVDEVVGRKTKLLFRSAGAKEIKERNDALERIGFHRGEARGIRKDGAECIVEIASATRKKGDGRVLMIQDITERKLAQEQLRAAMEQTEVAMRQKAEALVKLEESYCRLRELEVHRDSLIQMVCHDMKAPLQVLILQLDILKEMVIEKLDNDELESVDTLLAYSRQLEIMVHSMLDLSKLESGTLPLRRKPKVMESAVLEAVDFMRPMAGNCTIVTDVPRGVRPVNVDSYLVNRILINLMFNALKYSPGGEEIRLSLVAEEARIRVSVTDKGPGIPEEYREKIFEKFGQVQTEEHTRSGSTGLGLTFCKMAVEAHGGTIGVDSVEGRGSAFWFELPYDAADASTSAESSSPGETADVTTTVPRRT